VRARGAHGGGGLCGVGEEAAGEVGPAVARARYVDLPQGTRHPARSQGSADIGRADIGRADIGREAQRPGTAASRCDGC
jgi:hypothetical protein